MNRLVARVAWVALSLSVACGSPIVGGECRPGFAACDGRCVNLKTDPQHCGSCGYACGGFECNAGRCSTKPRADAGRPDAGIRGDGGKPLDGSVGSKRDAGRLAEAGVGRGGIGGPGTPGTQGTPFLPDGGLGFPDPIVSQGCGIGLTSCPGLCADTQSDRNHCGDCSTVCGSTKFCSRGQCVDICDPPLVPCGGACVDQQSDETNCGGCGNVCISGICGMGECSDAIPGSLVVIGHDYSSSLNQAMQRVAGNAVFLAPGSPVRALVYRGNAQTSSVNGVTQAISSVMQAEGRQVQSTDADSEQVSAQLRNATVFVVYPQPRSSDAELNTLGQKWGLALSQFLFRGGVVVLFETTSTSNSGTYKLLSPSGLFEAEKRETIARQSVTVVAPADAVAKSLTGTYAALSNSLRFLNVTSNGAMVVRDRDGEAVVFHRVIALP